MNSALVLGNGVSRLDLDLTVCQNSMPIYGCNALYRDFTPDVLVATDGPISKAIQESGYSKQHRFYTRTPLPNQGAIQIPNNWKGWSSGPIAAAYACYDQHEVIYLCGFDMGGVNGHFNNVYADTEFYKQSKDKPTFSGNWARQLIQLGQQYPDVCFVRLIGNTTAEIPELDRMKNLKHMPISHFIGRINNSGEL